MHKACTVCSNIGKPFIYHGFRYNIIGHLQMFTLLTQMPVACSKCIQTEKCTAFKDEEDKNTAVKLKCPFPSPCMSGKEKFILITNYNGSAWV